MNNTIQSNLISRFFNSWKWNESQRNPTQEETNNQNQHHVKFASGKKKETQQSQAPKTKPKLRNQCGNRYTNRTWKKERIKEPTSMASRMKIFGWSKRKTPLFLPHYLSSACSVWRAHENESNEFTLVSFPLCIQQK